MKDSIYRPTVQITQRISAALSRIDSVRWRIDSLLLLPKYEDWLHRDVSVRRAAGTTRIEGAEMDEKQVVELSRRAPSRLTEDQRANLNALRVYEFVDTLSDEPDVPIDELVMRHLNREFLHGIAPPLERPGAFRNGQNTVGIYTPPDQGDVPALTHALASWLNETTSMNPVLKAGLAHLEFVAIHPFWNGNGRTARAIATLILQRSAYSFRKRLSLENHMYNVRDTEYIPALERTLGREYRPDYEPTPWLEFFVDAVDRHAHDLLDVITEWHTKMELIHTSLRAEEVNERQSDALAFAALNGEITRADYIDVAKVSPATASRDLKRLIEVGWLQAKGMTRARVYELRTKPGPAAPVQMSILDAEDYGTESEQAEE